MDQLNLAEIFTEAALVFEKGSFCKQQDCGWACCAISRAVDNLGLTTTDYFAAQHRFHAKWGSSFWWGKGKTTENQLCRLDALWDMVNETREKEAA